ncbi:hypothetical protein RB8229 [Rhodopirellula baltica SH 1]|uniref:Uncharacterized protein n=1 Tax=Rhodopirellula baltica (strain DSM 10527 / NCIMB 13988 / SH1) TaxID=243090 RepID=Q7UFZ9_RHOBA|nr:hypothetical protein RB8229 [Rhodopirellula baltica SH 1]
MVVGDEGISWGEPFDWCCRVPATAADMGENTTKEGKRRATLPVYGRMTDLTRLHHLISHHCGRRAIISHRRAKSTRTRKMLAYLRHPASNRSTRRFAVC